MFVTECLHNKCLNCQPCVQFIFSPGCESDMILSVMTSVPSNPNTRLPLSLNTWQLQGCCFYLKASYPVLRLLSLLQLLNRSRESDCRLVIDNIFTYPLRFRCFVTWASLRQLMYLLKLLWGKGNTHWDYSYNFTCFWFTLFLPFLMEASQTWGTV